VHGVIVKARMERGEPPALALPGVFGSKRCRHGIRVAKGLTHQPTENCLVEIVSFKHVTPSAVTRA
jgi:hypothetical protein